MDLKRTQKSITWEGVSYTLSRPKLKQFLAFGKKNEAAESDMEKTDLLLDLFAECGLPRDVSEEMEPEHIEKISEELLGSKKK